MFGFRGKPVMAMEFVTPGVLDSAGVIRYFGLRMNSRTRNIMRIRFDKDAEGGFPGYTISPVALDYIGTGGIFRNIDIDKNVSDGFYNLAGLSIGAYEISGPAALLTPRTRKVAVDFLRPDLVYGYSFVNRGSTNANSNSAEGSPLLINWRLFQNLVFLRIAHVLSSTVNGEFPDNISCIHFYANSTTTWGKLPVRLKEIVFTGANASAASLNAMIAECVNLEGFRNGDWSQVGVALASVTNPLGATLDFSHTKLNRLILVSNGSLTSLTLPAATDFVSFFLQNTGLSTSAAAAIFEHVLDHCPTIKLLGFSGVNMGGHARNIVDADLPGTLQYLNLSNINISGDVTLTTARPSFLRLYMESTNGGAQKNVHPHVDISGLTNATLISITSSGVETLVLPVNSTVTQLSLQGNKISRAANPGLIARLTSYAQLNTLSMGVGNSSSNGQDSVDGLGPDLDLSAMTSLATVSLGYCKLHTLTLPTPATIGFLDIRNNPNLSAVNNISNKSFGSLYYGGTMLNIDLTNFPNLTNLICNNTAQTVIDLRSKTSGFGFTNFTYSDCLLLTTVYIGTTPIFFTGQYAGPRCPLLTNIDNMSNIYFTAASLTARAFSVQDCALNVTFPFGANNFVPYTINISNNGVSQANGDATVISYYNNRTKWDRDTIKTLTMGGSNAALSGTYQAPAGYDPDPENSDGTPASPKEMLYVLVEKYNVVASYN
jgi:hypothetical protein